MVTKFFLCFDNVKKKKFLEKYIMISDSSLMKISAVSIASFDQYHYGQIINALKNFKHVFCEKPSLYKRK